MAEAIRAPSQARSQRTMDEVYRSLDLLLKTKDFDRITILDLAAHANVAVGSIYARFKDKDAVLAGLYLRVAGQMSACLEPLSAPSRWKGKSDSEMVGAILKAIARFYRQQSHILRAAFLAHVRHIDESRFKVWQTAVGRFTVLLVERSPTSDPAMLELAVKAIVRFTTSTMIQMVLINWLGRWSGGISNSLMLDELSRFAQDVVARAQAGTPGYTRSAPH